MRDQKAWQRTLHSVVPSGTGDERLKNPGGWDYFDELLARIREIRASEKRFYQKVRDLFALSTDYRADDSAAQLFFAEVQNKLLYAVAQKTAAEIVVARANPDAPHMALTTWSRPNCGPGIAKRSPSITGGRTWIACWLSWIAQPSTMPEASAPKP
jgi:hypothetical protein